MLKDKVANDEVNGRIITMPRVCNVGNGKGYIFIFYFWGFCYNLFSIKVLALYPTSECKVQNCKFNAIFDTGGK